MSESPLTTHAGPIAAAAGGLFTVVSVGSYLVTDHRTWSPYDQPGLPALPPPTPSASPCC